MSYTTMYAFGADGNATDPVEFRNSHFHGPVIWSHLWKKYCYSPGDLDGEFGFMTNTDKLWALQSDPRLTDDEWYVFMCTMDNAVVPPELLERVRKAFLNFGQVLPEERINHSGDYVAAILQFEQKIPGLRGVCWWSTSVIDDPWMVFVEPDGSPDFYGDYRPYNLDKDTKHWFLTTREANTQMRDSAAGGVDVAVEQGIPDTREGA